MKFVEVLEQQLKDTGRELRATPREVAAYAAQRAAHLTSIANDPHIMDAVYAERDAVALYAGVVVTDKADATDVRIASVIQGMLAAAIV